MNLKLEKKYGETFVTNEVGGDDIQEFIIHERLKIGSSPRDWEMDKMWGRGVRSQTSFYLWLAFSHILLATCNLIIALYDLDDRNLFPL